MKTVLHGSRRLRIAVACNNPDNGLFAGRACFVQIYGNGWTMELDADDFIDGYAFSVDVVGLRIRLHRVWFPITNYREWVGNWCWNEYELKRPQAIRLMQHLRAVGFWYCTAGPTRLYEWFNAKEAEHV